MLLGSTIQYTPSSFRLTKFCPQRTPFLHYESNCLLLIVQWVYMFNVVNDLLQEVSLSDQCLWSFIFEMCEVDV